MESFGRECGFKVYREGDGIEHVVLIEDGHIVPWDIVLGTDSHTCTNGAMGALAFGVGTTDGAYAMATGHIYDFVVPETFQFELIGAFQNGVYAKDLILHIIGAVGAGGCSRRVASGTPSRSTSARRRQSSTRSSAGTSGAPGAA